MPFRTAGRQLRRLNDFCGQDTGLGHLCRTVRNSTGAYFGLKAAGIAASYVTGSRDLDTVADLAAPWVAGGYAMSQAHHFSTGAARDLLIVGIAAAAGADFFSELSNYSGQGQMLRLLRDQYAVRNAHISNSVTNVHSPGFTGSALTGLAAIIARVYEGYRRQ